MMSSLKPRLSDVSNVTILPEEMSSLKPRLSDATILPEELSSRKLRFTPAKTPRSFTPGKTPRNEMPHSARKSVVTFADDVDSPARKSEGCARLSIASVMTDFSCASGVSDMSNGGIFQVGPFVQSHLPSTIHGAWEAPPVSEVSEATRAKIVAARKRAKARAKARVGKVARKAKVAAKKDTAS